jgi:hypothetical protein
LTVNVLVVADGGRFAGGADRGDAINAALDLRLYEALEGRDVNLAVLERRDDGGISSGEHKAALASEKRPGLARMKFGPKQ